MHDHTGPACSQRAVMKRCNRYCDVALTDAYTQCLLPYTYWYCGKTFKLTQESSPMAALLCSMGLAASIDHKQIGSEQMRHTH